MAGNILNLTCSISLPSGVTGSPEFEWDGPLTSTNISNSVDGMLLSILTLSDIAPSDAGPYTCTATLGGSVSTTVNVSVEGNNEVFQLQVFSVMYTLFPAVQAPIPSVIHTTLQAGTTSNLTCIYSLMDDFPHDARATWRVDKSNLTQNDRVLIEGVTLSFFPLKTSESGVYSCELTITSLTPHVIIEGSPKTSAELLIVVESKSIQ